MKNYSYITLLSDDSYIYGVILLNESLKRVNSQYPLEVVVTSNVTKPILNILEQLNIKYTIIEPIKNDSFLNYNKNINASFAKTWSLCLTKLKLFNLTQFDKIIFLDSDIMVLKNLDNLFECAHMTSALDGEYFNLWPDDPHFNSGILVIEPNEAEYNNLINFVNNFSLTDWAKPQCIADQEILNLYYKDWSNQPELHLNKYYDIFAPYVLDSMIEDVDANCYFIHFVGRKPWRGFLRQDKEVYTEKYYTDARTIIQEVLTKINWIAVRNELKVAIYSICKDEILNVEKFIKCFSKADYLCILDTGSTDGTWEYLQQAQEKYPNLIIKQEIINPWRYDTARNLSLTLVPEDTTIYFMMDLDEIIKENDWMDMIKLAWDPLFSRGYYTYYRQVDKTTDAPIQTFQEYRIHNKNWHYKGLVHEQLYNITDTRDFYADESVMVPICVWHYPTNPNRVVYIELCERGVEEEPMNWLMHLQLAAEYEVHKEYEKAIIEYRKIIAESDTLAEVEIGRAYASLGRCLGLLERNEESLNAFKKGRSFIPTYGDNYFLAAEVNYKLKNYKEVINLCETGLAVSHESYWCTIVNHNSHFPYLLLGLAHYYSNNKILGLGYITIAKEKNNNEELNKIYTEVLNTIINGM